MQFDLLRASSVLSGLKKIRCDIWRTCSSGDAEYRVPVLVR